jgi:quercetin dioxygenase-like cupin family protein
MCEQEIPMQNVQFNDDRPFQEIGKGVSRKIRSYDEQLMPVEVHFEEGAIGEVHRHEHIQVTYVLDGVFEFTKNGVSVVVRKGDTLLFKANEPHGTICKQTGTLLDIFTPYRKEFLEV